MSPTPGLAAALAGVSRRGAVSGATVAHAARPASPVPRSRPATAHASGVGAGQSGHGQWPARGWPSTLAGAARRSASPPLLVFRPEHAVGSRGSCQLGPWRWRHVHGRTRGSVATEEKGAGGDGARRPAGGARPSGEPPRLACSVGSARRGGAVGCRGETPHRDARCRLSPHVGRVGEAGCRDACASQAPAGAPRWSLHADRQSAGAPGVS